MKKVYVAIVLFILAFAVPVTVYSLVTGEFDLRDRASEEDDGNASTPQIVSVPVTIATVNEEYNYIVKAIDNDLADVSELDFIVDQKPIWLEWDEERNMFSGTPTSSSVGAHSVTIKVSDGKWLGSQKFNIEVEAAIVDEGTEEALEEQEETSQLEDYGFETTPESSTTISQPIVLGETDTELPDTAGMGLFVGISFGFAILVLGLYFWLDSKYQLTDRFSRKIEFALGRQTSFEFDNGLTVKRRKSKI